MVHTHLRINRDYIDFMHIATFFTVMTVAQLVGTLFLPIGTKKLGKKGYLIFLQMLMSVGFLVMFLFPNAGIPFPSSL